MIWYPSLYNVDIASTKSRRKACLGQSLFTVSLKRFGCREYTDPVPSPWFGGIGL